MNDKYDNSVTAHTEAAAECIPIKQRNKYRMASESIFVWKKLQDVYLLKDDFEKHAYSKKKKKKTPQKNKQTNKEKPNKRVENWRKPCEKLNSTSQKEQF